MLTNVQEFPYTLFIFSLVLVLFILVFIFFIVLFIITYIRYHKNQVEIEESVNTLRVFIIYLKTDQVTFFNRSSPSKKRTVSISEFFSQFPDDEKEKLVSWLSSLVSTESEEVAPYLEINVIISKLQRKYFSLLQVQKIDKEEKIIYLESFLLKNDKKKAHNKSHNPVVSSEEEIAKLLLSSSSSKGMTYAFCFYHKRSSFKVNSRGGYALMKIRELLLQHLGPHQYLLPHSNTQFIFFDLHSSSRAQALLLINEIKRDIDRFLSLEGLDENIKYTIGIAENRFLQKDHRELINTTIKLASIAKEEDEEMMFYESGMNAFKIHQDEYRSEVERIIKDKKIIFSFRAIYNVEKRRTIGYLSISKPIDTFFNTIEELKDYAYRVEDDKELFATIATNVIWRFNSQKPVDTLRLFFPIRFFEKYHVIKSLVHISKIKETHLVLLLDTNDLLNSLSSENDLIIEIKNLKVLGYEVALSLYNKDLTLPSRVYELFDYFIIDKTMTQNLKSSTRAQIEIHNLMEKLLGYNKPIIVSDLPNWNSIELMIKIGATYISSEALSPSEEMLLPISSKSLNKLKSMK